MLFATRRSSGNHDVVGKSYLSQTTRVQLRPKKDTMASETDRASSARDPVESETLLEGNRRPDRGHDESSAKSGSSDQAPSVSPIFAAVLYACCSASMNFANKAVFVDFNFQATTLLLQMMFTIVVRLETGHCHPPNRWFTLRTAFVSRCC